MKRSFDEISPDEEEYQETSSEKNMDTDFWADAHVKLIQTFKTQYYDTEGNNLIHGPLAVHDAA